MLRHPWMLVDRTNEQGLRSSWNHLHLMFSRSCGIYLGRVNRQPLYKISIRLTISSVANSWVNLFLARFVLGFGIGPKSSTVPVYAAECAPAPIRGALVMQWQMWTAFGIMLGNIMGVAFGPSTGISPDLGWRLMLGSTVVLPLIVCAQVYYCPESPRWYIQHHKPAKAFQSFQRLRFTNMQAARDTYYTYVGVELERKANKGKNLFTQFIELFTVPRNRRATLASWIVMFGQQFCGVNVIAYVSRDNVHFDNLKLTLGSIQPPFSLSLATAPTAHSSHQWAPAY